MGHILAGEDIQTVGHILAQEDIQTVGHILAGEDIQTVEGTVRKCSMEPQIFILRLLPGISST